MSKRTGFTLLEMVLALAIGLVLMISLYNVLNMQVYQSQAGRLVQQEATLAHHIFARMSRDILANMGPVPVVPPVANASAASASATGASQSTTPAATTGATATSATTTTTDTSNTITFNSGVYGTNNVLILSTTKVPFSLDPTNAFSVDPTQQATTSDLRRVSYWLAAANGVQSGLAYQELMVATSNDLSTFPSDMSPDSYTILASEVKDIQFQYFDGVNWQDSWDGTTLGGPAGDIPIGPPSAIKIILTLNRKAPDNTDLTDDQLPKFTHVVAIPGGNNFPQTNP
jgi:prepilin-type N-terminal cleavage/methylation domain-containing protein